MVSIKLKSKVEITDSDPAWHIVRVPRKKVEHFNFKGNLRRVVCSLNGCKEFHCSLFPSRGDYFITLSKQLRTKLGIDAGDPVTVEIAKDDSKYGMPMPDEFAEVMRQDPDGAKLFEALSPGNQKLLLKLVVMVRDVDKRIARSLVALEVLRQCGGKFDYHTQHEAMRQAMKLGKII